MSARKQENQIDVFKELKNSILNTDPVYFLENNINLDGTEFRLSRNGYKPFADIYRYIGIKALEKSARPVVLVKGRQVGATTMAAALECYFMACGLFGKHGKPPMRMMHIFPTLALAQAYTKDKLDPMISMAKPVPGALKQNGTLKSMMEVKLDTSSPSNNNMQFKRFLGNNQVWIESTGLDGDRLRGRTIDAAFYDECQDMSGVAIGASSKMLTKAQYGSTGEGIQVYFGTPKQKGSEYFRMWQSSSQQYYHLLCDKCEKHFPLYRPDVNWEEIWLYGFIVKCTNCGHEQDKREAAENGKWISIVDEPENTRFVGYHINQLYIPEFTREFVLSAKPENSAINTERIYQNEVLGEFYDGEGATISKDEIRDLHIGTPDAKRQITRKITPEDKCRAYAGFDWGQRGNWSQIQGKQRGQSFSCGVVLTAQSPELFQVEFAMKIPSNDPDYKMDVVREMMRRYTIHKAVGDIGDAHDLSHYLQKEFPQHFLASRAGPKINGRIKYDKDIFPRTIMFEREYYISELMGLLKKGAIRFPFADKNGYEKINWLLDHCCSMEIKVTQDRSGEPVRRYIKGPTPNDGFMALLNAYLAYKFDITQGFSIKQPQFMQYGQARQRVQIPAIIGRVPKL